LISLSQKNFSSLRMTARIGVIRDDRIAELGAHDHLMRQ
jgi:hypothetical protein